MTARNDALPDSNLTPRCDELAREHRRIMAGPLAPGVAQDWIRLAQTLEREFRAAHLYGDELCKRLSDERAAHERAVMVTVSKWRGEVADVEKYASACRDAMADLYEAYRERCNYCQGNYDFCISCPGPCRGREAMRVALKHRGVAELVDVPGSRPGGESPAGSTPASPTTDEHLTIQHPDTLRMDFLERDRVRLSVLDGLWEAGYRMPVNGELRSAIDACIKDRDAALERTVEIPKEDI